MAENLTISELREILRENSVATDGSKSELLARVMQLDEANIIVQRWISKKEVTKRNEIQTAEFEMMKEQIKKIEETLKSLTALLKDNIASNQSTTGYEKDKDVDECKPICEHGCLNGRCIAPNTCACNDGYRKVLDYACAPICSQDCFMGTCTAPDTCTYRKGFKLSQKSLFLCKPTWHKHY